MKVSKKPVMSRLFVDRSPIPVKDVLVNEKGLLKYASDQYPDPIREWKGDI